MTFLFQMDIRTASQKVREAYKSYYQLKTLALQDSLMDITFSDDRENITSLDMSEIKHTVTSVEADKVIDQSDHISQHRIALADIQNGNDVDCSACGNEKTVSNVEECVKDVVQEQNPEDLKDIWGSHLNKNANKVSDSGTKTLHQRSTSFHFSEKLFVGSKFSKKNPRKSRSFSRPSKSTENDGFPVLPFFEVKKMPSEYEAHEHQDDMLQASANRNATESASNSNSELSLKGLLEEKLRVVRPSTLITNQSVSAIHRAVMTSDSCEQKCTPSKTIDKGWLDRCTKLNSLEHQATPVNDSGIESMESSTATDYCSITKTPKLLQPDSDIAEPLHCTKPEQCLTLPDVTANEKQMLVVAVPDDSDEDIIYNSEESENEERVLRMGRITCGKKRKLYDSDIVFPLNSTKKQKILPEDVPEDTLIEIPSAADINKIAEAIVSTENSVKKKKCAISGKLTKKQVLERKMSTGEANDNFVRININKKVYVRGKKNNSYSKYKKAEWKKKKKMANSAVDDVTGSNGVLKCFKCGDMGHFARNCLNAQGQCYM
jgi:ATP-dependent DNA helicase Q4